MLKTFVVLSCDTVAEVRDPATPKMLTPLLIFEARRLASPEMVCLPVRYVPAAISCALVPGVMVAAAFVVTDAVSVTDALCAVPADTYPAVTTGVIDTLFVSVSVFVPVETVADDPETVEGPFAEPAATALDAAEA